jgi:arginase
MSQREPQVSKMALIGAPSSAGARMAGQEQAPRALRAAGLVQSLQSNGFEVQDLGDIPHVTFTPDTKNPKQQNLPLVLNTLNEVRDKVDSAVSDRKWPLIIGGDCTITIGVLAALNKHYPSLGMIYLDGDVDLNTPETTLSGIFDGMVLGHIVGKGNKELSHFGARLPILDGRNITLFGYSAEAGGIDPIEKEQLKVTSMDKYPLEKVRDGAKKSATHALKALESKVEHILVHFDIDVIDHDDFPAADVPHKPGLKLKDVREALSVFLKSPKTIGLVVTEFNASQDSDGRLAKQLVELIRKAKRPKHLR